MNENIQTEMGRTYYIRRENEEIIKTIMLVELKGKRKKGR
jgi:hypothetical protein